ncbi:MAG: transposase [Elusimicrobiota bacterium]|nr:transposase [Elusimicrobiota bacterium]
MKNPPDSRPPRPQPAVISTLGKFIECGVMRYGAVRFRCPKRGHDVFVALSCKCRGCPNCDAKRSAVITGQALERLLAFVPCRQRVLVVPKRLRYFLSQNPALEGELSRIFADEINHFLCQNTTGTPAQLHFIKRFGGVLNLHIHIHALVSDGVFSLKMNVLGRSELVFTPVPCPTDRQLAAIVTAVRKRFIRRVRRACGLSQEAADNLLSWKNSGFSIHEEVLIKDLDREGLERLLGYCSRPALSQKRLVYSEKANAVLYRTEPKAGKSEMLVMTPVEFLRRWTLLMPPPKAMPVPYQELCSSNGQQEPGPLLRRPRAQVTAAAATGSEGGKRGGPDRPAGKNR